MSEELLQSDGQPNGETYQRTMDVVTRILDDGEFATEVAEHNGFYVGSNEKIAIAFLAHRFQWAVDLLSRQTKTLLDQQNGLAADVDYLMCLASETRESGE